MPTIRYLALALIACCACALAQAASTDRLQKLENRTDVLEASIAAKLDANEAKVSAQIEAARRGFEATEKTVVATQKSVDWWIGFLSTAMAVLGVVVAVVGIFIPYLIGRKQRAELESRLGDAEKIVRELEQHRDKVREISKELENRRIDDPDKAATRALVEKTAADPQASDRDHLFAAALKHSQADQLAEALPLWRALLALDGKSAVLHFNLALTLQKFSGIQPTQRMPLLEEACERYAEAARLKPDMHAAFNNWGNALYDWARALDAAERPAKFAETCGKYAEAARLKPDYHEAFNNWGNALADWALALDAAERPAKFAEACGKFAEAARLKPDDHEAFNNWGNALADWALALDAAERPAKFAEACGKFAEAARLKPDSHEAFNNWGITLLHWAGALGNAEAAIAIRAQASEKLLEAERLQPGSGAYDLACLAAVEGNADDAKDWLEKSATANRLPDCEHLRTDSDLNNLRALPWFADWLRTVCDD